MSEETHKVEIVNDKRSGLGTASMVLGIIAIVGSWIPFLNVFSIILGVVGLCLGIPSLILFLVKKKGTIGKPIAGLILCALTLVFAVNVNSTTSQVINENIDDLNNNLDELNGGKTEEILENDLEVIFGIYTTDGNEYYESGKLEVTVTNKTADSQSYSIDIEALDNAGARIATDTIYVSSIGANQSAKYDAFTFSNVSKLKEAKSFKVYEVNKY